MFNSQPSKPLWPVRNPRVVWLKICFVISIGNKLLKTLFESLIKASFFFSNMKLNCFLPSFFNWNKFIFLRCHSNHKRHKYSRQSHIRYLLIVFWLSNEFALIEYLKCHCNFLQDMLKLSFNFLFFLLFPESTAILSLVLPILMWLVFAISFTCCILPLCVKK